ncbi:MAG: ABC transporter ATP-binding protein [Candidatus Lokiarchaeota archaeon]|nr:ABC transporter ATP-binding protein [Candidatus Lokiarchaeota archaeon]
MKRSHLKKHEIHPDFTEDMDVFMRNCYVSYDKRKIVLHNVSLDVKKGGVLGLIGGSGSGKSTILRCLTGQISPHRGIVRTANCDVIKDNEKLVNKIGYVPQLEYLSLYYDFNPIDNCIFFGRNYQLTSEEIKSRVKRIFAILGFEDEDILNRPVKNLSGGEKKRVSIAVGLINTPSVLFLDEPTTGLDPHLRIDVLNFLLKVNQEFGTTMVIVSHDLEIVDYCTKIAILNHGRVTGYGRPVELIESLPSNGKSVLLELESFNPQQKMERIFRVDGVQYVLNAGRNKLKLFVQDTGNISKILDQLYEMKFNVKSFSIDKGTFLDYFRLKGGVSIADLE